MLDFIRSRGAVHPRDVDAHFAHGKVTNWFGGSSNASTQLLDVMHYRGLLRVARREGGTRVYAARLSTANPQPVGNPQSLVNSHSVGNLRSAPLVGAASASARMDALLDVVVQKYAPLPASGLGHLASLLCGGAPQWRTQRGEALARAQQRLGHERIDGIDWYWPSAERPASVRWRPDEGVRLLTPFDPIVWDRRRFEIFWGWAYRFEAYTPAPKRKLGYYALPLLWHERVLGWANVTVIDGGLQSSFGYVDGRAPRAAAFRTGLEAELSRLRSFLGIAA